MLLSTPPDADVMQLPSTQGSVPATLEVQETDTDGSLDLPREGLSSLSIHGLIQSSRDPRSSSTQSLVPSKHDGTNADQKRTLLVVYIHGFMGNNSSFRSFPAHVHNLLKELLSATHSVHTKIYPRYKTYKAIDVATENFSTWLAPHESPSTDVVLVGHSMGGLLAAEIVLLVWAIFVAAILAGSWLFPTKTS